MAEKGLTTYISLFHRRDNAVSAIRALESAGFTKSAITIIGGGIGSGYSQSAGTFGADYGYGDQSTLEEIGVPEGDRKHLQGGLADGGTVISLEGSGDRADEIETIFAKYSAKKIDETDINRAPLSAPVAAVTPVSDAVDSAVIPVTQEDLVVGKRQVDRGGVRVYRRMVEEPVTEAVTLREEHVVIDRRPVDRAVTQADLVNGGQVIELTETAEEAVVGKTARVIEEVRVGKEATQHTETVHDTVRHTEVDVEQVASTDTSVLPTKY